VLRMQSPDFRPQDLALTFHLPAGEQESVLGSALPVAGEGDEDVIGSLVRLLQKGTTSWQSLIPDRSGDSTITVRLENEAGDLLLGRQINTRVRADARTRIRRGTVVACATVGTLGVLIAAAQQVTGLLLG